MDPRVRQTLILKLRAMLRRGRHDFDPPGCAHCGVDCTGALCGGCEALLACLDGSAALRPAPSPTYVSEREDFARRSDAKFGARKTWLPFGDEP